MPDRPTVLIVDDNVESLRNRKELFADSGMIVRESTTFEAAKELIAADVPLDVAIIDINLSDDPRDQSGVELARLLRQQRPGLPIVAYTAYYAEDALGSELRDLFAEWVVKGSMSVATLDEFVERCSALARAHRDAAA